MLSKSKVEKLQQILQNQILVLDGGMGTMIQKYNLQEIDYRFEGVKDVKQELKGCNDFLCLSKPEIISEIHMSYLLAGANIIETNTFNATPIPLSDYGVENFCYEINLKAAQIARNTINKFKEQNSDNEDYLFVAGVLGPTNRTLSISPDVNDPSKRNVTFDELSEGYKEAAKGLVDGNVDILLIETIFDTLNAKACAYALMTLFEEIGYELPIMISGTISDSSGRTLSGQTIEAFYNSLRYIKPISFGLNCALGPIELKQHLESLSSISETFVSVHPNAGLPNEFGLYDLSPEDMCKHIAVWGEQGLLNIVGGCCGTTPEHIKLIKNSIVNCQPRKIPDLDIKCRLSGLEALNISKDTLFINVGERTNVTGSAKFRRLIKEGNFDEALAIARMQVDNGAQIIDINMDEGLIDAKACMIKFLNLVASEPEISKVPIMIDSSKWDVLVEGLKCVQGKSIINSISMKEGEDLFLSHAETLKKLGAAVVVMAFDEQGQADTYDRKIEICTRAYNLLVNKVGFPPEDIIFDPNIFAVATGMVEHNNYALDFINSVKTIKEKLPYALISGGVSNVSFSFRGNEFIRQAIHTVFLYHAISNGMDMGIVNAGMLSVYSDIPTELRDKIEAVILNTSEQATDELIALAEEYKNRELNSTNNETVNQWRNENIKSRIEYAMLKGIADYIEDDVKELLKEYDNPVSIIEGPLMEAMNKVGDLFGEGKMFLPQVVKSARVMKKAVSFLEPYIKEGQSNTTSNGKILMATVKGDVHDIGKNIVSVVMQCNNYEIIDLGVMVPCEQIIETAIKENVDIIGLSGLITPSLDEMVHVIRELEKRGLNIPVMIGGATTSKAHTAVKMEHEYSAPIVYVNNASRGVTVAQSLLSKELRLGFLKKLREEYAFERKLHEIKYSKNVSVSYEEAKQNCIKVDYAKTKAKAPNMYGVHVLDIDINSVKKFIDWQGFVSSWDYKVNVDKLDHYPKLKEEVERLLVDGKDVLNELIQQNKLTVKVQFGLFKTRKLDTDDLVVTYQDKEYKFSFLRNQLDMSNREESSNYCLADFFDEEDCIGILVVNAGIGLEKILAELKADDEIYKMMLTQTVADRIAEATTEYAHYLIRTKYWGYSCEREFNSVSELNYKGIRPAIGYSTSSDHRQKKIIWDLLDCKNNIGLSLTESYMMNPVCATCCFVLGNSEAYYSSVGGVMKDQIQSYSQRTNTDVSETEQYLQRELAYIVEN